MSNTNTIHELQQQITFQEQILDSLNTSVTKQQIQHNPRATTANHFPRTNTRQFEHKCHQTT